MIICNAQDMSDIGLNAVNTLYIVLTTDENT